MAGLSWKMVQIDLQPDNGFSGEQTLDFGQPIASFAVGLSAFQFVENNLNPQEFNLTVSSQKPSPSTVTVIVNATYQDINGKTPSQASQSKSWAQISVLVWLDDGQGDPPLILANADVLLNDGAGSEPILGQRSLHFDLRKSHVASFLSGFEFSMGTLSSSDPKVITDVQAYTGISGNGIPDMGIKAAGVFSARNPSSSPISPKVGGGLIVFPQTMPGFAMATMTAKMNIVTTGLTTKMGEPLIKTVLPFGNKVKRLFKLIQGFNLGMNPYTATSVTGNVAMSINGWNNNFDERPQTFNSYMAMTYDHKNAVTPTPFFYGYGQVTWLLIAELES